MLNSIVCGNALDKLALLETNSVDLVCTDPPYGYSFMGKDWDKAVPGVDIWRECLRALKPGAFCFVMSAPRSDVQMHMISNLEQAGFRIDFTPIYWTYASGFPKAGNIGKLVDKRLGAEREVIIPDPEAKRRSKNRFVGIMNGGHISDDNRKAVNITAPASSQSKATDGSYAGFQPKPAVEVILVAMKPLSEKTYVDQALKNGKGVTWLDDCRIPFEQSGSKATNPNMRDDNGSNSKDYGASPMFARERAKLFFNSQGRFPANLLVSDDVLNIEHKGSHRHQGFSESKARGWKMTSKSGVNRVGYNDSGSYSRYFDLDRWANQLPFLIVPKASKSEKNKGLGQHPDTKKFVAGNYSQSPVCETCDKTLNGTNDHSNCSGKVYYRKMDTEITKNNHPTVKPLKLMSYLVTLGSRKGNTVLDPFVDSGTTCLAAKHLGRNYIGIERESEYVEIANARLAAVVTQDTLL